MRHNGPTGSDATDNNDKIYTLTDFEALNFTELATLLTSLETKNLGGLFRMSKEAELFYNNKERNSFLANTMLEAAKKCSADKDFGLAVLVEVIRSGFHLGKVYPQLKELNSWENKELLLLPTMKAILANPEFKILTKGGNILINSLGFLFTRGIADEETLNLTADFLNKINFVELYKESPKDSFIAVKRVCDGINIALEGEFKSVDKNAEKSIFLNKVEPIFNAFVKSALTTAFTEARAIELVIENIYGVAKIGRLLPRERAVLALMEIMKAHTEYSLPYVTAVKSIEEYYNGKDEKDQPLDIKTIREETKKRVLPQTFSFDNGKFVFIVGDKFTKEKVTNLYWATKEVKAQFHRFLGLTDKVRDKAKDGDVLYAIIYNDPDEYSFNEFLYDCSTNNGGLFIEKQGWLFTYDRTIAQSIYTLEELFRHEYVHFLQSEFINPSFFGDDIYENDRISWFDEGGAEFISGATRYDGIAIRKIMAKNIAKEKSNRMTLPEVVVAKYSGGFTFYTYAFAFFSFAYAKQKQDVLLNIIELIKKKDCAGLDLYIQTLREDSQLCQEYEEWMDYLNSNYETFSLPQVAPTYQATVTPRTAGQVYDELVKSFGLTESSCEIYDSNILSAVKVKGIYTGNLSGGEKIDWQKMNATADAMLLQLNHHSWKGYLTYTAYFDKYKVDNQGNFTYELTLFGLVENK